MCCLITIEICSYPSRAGSSARETGAVLVANYDHSGIRSRVIANPPDIELIVTSMMRTNAQTAIERAQPDDLGAPTNAWNYTAFWFGRPAEEGTCTRAERNRGSVILGDYGCLRQAAGEVGWGWNSDWIERGNLPR
jgi:hypothetical protein